MFEQYRETHATREKLTNRAAVLVRSAAAVRRRKTQQTERRTPRKTKAKKEPPRRRELSLSHIRARLRTVNRRYSRLREQVAAVGYSVAVHYWPRFYVRQPRERDHHEAAAHSIEIPPTDDADCIQAAACRVVAVAHRYAPDRGTLLNFLTKVCQNEFRLVIRRTQHRSIALARYADAMRGDPQKREQQARHEAAAGTEPPPSVVVIADLSKLERPTAAYATYSRDDEAAAVHFREHEQTPSAKPTRPLTMRRLLEHRRGRLLMANA